MILQKEPVLFRDQYVDRRTPTNHTVLQPAVPFTNLD